MKFVDILDTNGNRLAVNPAHIVMMHAGSGGFIITLRNDRRITTTMFRSIEEAVKFCTTTEVDISSVGKRQR